MLALLLHRSHSLGSGLCFQHRSLLQLDNTAFTRLLTSSSLASNSTTQLAMEQTGSPFFSDALAALVGGLAANSTSSEKIYLSRSSEPMQLFLRRLANVLPLPSSATWPLLQLVIFVHCLVWFTLQCLILLQYHWKYQKENTPITRTGTGAPGSGKESVVDTAAKKDQ
jgi:hypothetical protein